jgi:lipopolysaccharide biosynthesis glycosyltransferase
MNKYFKKAKLEFFYWRKCIFEYRNFWKYIYTRYFLSKQILKHKGVLEKPINNPDLSVHILTCHQDFVMSLWLLASFYQFSGISGQLHIHNDGSLTQNDKNNFKKFFPSCKIIEPFDILDNQNLQTQKEIIKFRQKHNHPFVKKIIDSYFVSDQKYHLLLDSDLVWYGDFEIASKTENSFMMKCPGEKCFVYFKNNQKLKDDLAGYNAGVVFYDRENFDLEKLREYILKFDTEKENNFYFFEQAGHAFCLKKLKGLPEDKFILKADRKEDTILRHYTSPRRPLFYAEGLSKIKKIIKL